MGSKGLVLTGKHVRLEPLEHRPLPGLAAASAGDASLYEWSPVPRGEPEAVKYVETALAWRNAETAVPFATVRIFWNLEQWSGSLGHPRHSRHEPDACEIGYTWLSHAAVRTAANTETKLLMLAHAFETWQVLRVCFHTDARNQRSRAALERIGGKFEGILRAHRIC